MLAPRDLPLLAVFTSVVKEGSFVGAARALRMSKSAVSEQVGTLEKRCGVRLLERTTRTMRPTQAGVDICAAAEKALCVLDEVHAIVEREGQSPVGTLRVFSTLDLGHRYVAPAIADLCKRFPDLRAELKFDDREVDWLALGADVAIRHGVPKISSFVTRKLATDEEIIVAAPGLAKAWSHARTPSEMQAAPWVAHEHVVGPKPLVFHGPGERQERVSPASLRVVASSIEAVRALVLAEAGIALLPRHCVADAMRAGTLVQVLVGWRRRRIGIYALLPSRHFLPRRVSLFLEAMTAIVRP